eukprot:COSAG02_NODE_365_length_23749_cov_13.908584_7_plen_108_part_00
MSTYVFWKNYSRLHGLQSTPVVRNRAVLPWAPAETLPWWHGDRNTFYFMVRDYSPRWYFWEIVEFIRKFALTGNVADSLLECSNLLIHYSNVRIPEDLTLYFCSWLS